MNGFTENECRFIGGDNHFHNFKLYALSGSGLQKLRALALITKHLVKLSLIFPLLLVPNLHGIFVRTAKKTLSRSHAGK